MGLSQRDLSTKSGVPQAQISKFENGTVDLRLSSLVALFRALGLELELVPRKSVPAVQSIVRSTALRLTIDPEQFAKAQMAFACVLQGISKSDQWSGEFKRLREHMSFLETVRIPAAQINNFKRWAKYLEHMQKTPIDFEKIKKLRLLKKGVQILEKDTSRGIIGFAKILDVIPPLPRPETALRGGKSLLLSSDFNPLT